jgi:hypothetical protein
MLSISLAGLIGAVVGTIIAALVYAPLALAIERRVRGLSTRQGQPSHGEISILRRAVLTADIVAFGGGGYWLGATIAG